MNALSNDKLLGIMVICSPSDHQLNPPFTGRGFYRRLCKLGEQAGLEVIVFDPILTDWQTKTVNGYLYDASSGRWHHVRKPIPPVIYDRCFFTGRSQYVRYKQAIERLRSTQSVRCIIRGLSGKWQVQQMLSRHSFLRAYLPRTRRLADIRQVTQWLLDEQACILKPNAGSHGKKIVRVRSCESGGYEVKGRDSLNRPVHAAFDSSTQLLHWLSRFIGSRKYLLQESLSLHTASGQSFDVRSLVQKSGDGRWHMTGMAVRVGPPGSLTANIHGGGTSSPLRPFLYSHYGPSQAEAIIRELRSLSHLIPRQLESETGTLVELGIDFGIDLNGKVWILEVNSKPGRSVFAQLRDARRSRASVSNLIHYAHYLFDRQLGGLTK